MIKTKALVSGFCFLSALSVGLTQSSHAFTLSTANPLYSFGTQTYGNGSNECTNSPSLSLTCNGSAAGANVGAGISFGDFMAVGLGTASTPKTGVPNGVQGDYGFERGAATTVDSLGFKAEGANAFPINPLGVNSGKYFSFKATISPKFALAVSTINFSVSASGSRADFLAFENNVLLATLATNVATNGTYQIPAGVFNLTPTTFFNTSTTLSREIEFRILAYNVNAQQGYGVDAVGFNGSVEPIPFEFSPALGVSTLGGLYASNRLLRAINKRKNLKKSLEENKVT